MAGMAVTLLVGCDPQCENGYKIKKEYSTIFDHETWHESDKDMLLYGAIRTSTWTYKDGRVLRVRCFPASAPSSFKQYDIRYSIEVPLLVRVVPELEKAGPIEFVISVDGVSVGSVPTRIIAQKESIDFLAKIEPSLIDKLQSAKKTVVVMPRQKGERLDDVTEFKEVTGIGDRAFWAYTETGAEFVVMKGATVLGVSLGGKLPKPPASYEAALRAAASAAAAKL